MKKFSRIGIAAMLTAGLTLGLGSCGNDKQASANQTADLNKPSTLTVWCWDQNFNIYAMNEAAKIQRESKWPLDAIKALHSYKEYER